MILFVVVLLTSNTKLSYKLIRTSFIIILIIYRKVQVLSCSPALVHHQHLDRFAAFLYPRSPLKVSRYSMNIVEKYIFVDCNGNHLFDTAEYRTHVLLLVSRRFVANIFFRIRSTKQKHD